MELSQALFTVKINSINGFFYVFSKRRKKSYRERWINREKKTKQTELHMIEHVRSQLRCKWSTHIATCFFQTHKKLHICFLIITIIEKTKCAGFVFFPLLAYSNPSCSLHANRSQHRLQNSLFLRNYTLHSVYNKFRMWSIKIAKNPFFRKKNILFLG